MKHEVISISGEALDRLGINYRAFPSRDGIFLFCKILSNGLTFDLKYDGNGVLRLWRFVDTIPDLKAGKRCEFQEPNHPHTTIGIEITDEGDVCFYAQQQISNSIPKRSERIHDMVNLYAHLIAYIDTNKSILVNR